MTDIVPNFVPNDWTSENAMIKVIGVGGGGVNAVSYMYEQGIDGCHFIVCNTDSGSLACSKVPDKIQLGEGLGAGTDPTKGRNAALGAQEIIEKKVLRSGTKMLFITAGLGGGTGSGAAPVIAKMARKHPDILTVAVVTIPFREEGTEVLARAADSIHELENNVDSLLVIDNENLYAICGDMPIYEAFPKTDEVLATAVKGIMEIITKDGYINVDFNDVKTMMKDSGMALMGHGEGRGKNRLEEAVKGAFESPLLGDFDLSTACNLLVNITCGRNKDGLLFREKGEISRMIKERVSALKKSKMGLVYDDDPNFGDKVSITAIVTGFKMDLSAISGLDKMNGRLIIIDNDYEYREDNTSGCHSAGEEVSMKDDIVVEKVGFSSNVNQRKFHFGPDEKPVLIAGGPDRRTELMATSAIRRSTTRKSTEE